MHNLVMEAKNQITAILTDALAAAMNDGTLPQGESAAFVVEVPADKKNGDFASNCAMVNARTFRKAPRQIAEAIASHANLEGTYCDRIEMAMMHPRKVEIPPHDCDLELLRQQQHYMGCYLGTLEKRAIVEGIDLD